MINQDSFVAIRPELTSGESILWAGQPNPHVIFHKQDMMLIPFSLMWGGFAIFWEAGVAGFWGSASHAGSRWIFGMIWGIPFVVVGQYLIWGRFVYAAWKKKRTHYAVTNRRVIVVQEGCNRQTSSAFIASLPTIVKEDRANGSGSLSFATPALSGNLGSGAWNTMAVGAVPTFVDIDDVDSVYRLVSDLSEKAHAAKAAAF